MKSSWQPRLAIEAHLRALVSPLTFPPFWRFQKRLAAWLWIFQTEWSPHMHTIIKILPRFLFIYQHLIGLSMKTDHRLAIWKYMHLLNWKASVFPSCICWPRASWTSPGLMFQLVDTMRHSAESKHRLCRHGSSVFTEPSLPMNVKCLTMSNLFEAPFTPQFLGKMKPQEA